jgi:hypothetical protein
MCATNGRTMTDYTPLTVGECPNEPEDPISIEAYERVIAAMDKLCAEAPRLHRTAPLALRSPSPVLRDGYRAADGLR